MRVFIGSTLDALQEPPWHLRPELMPKRERRDAAHSGRNTLEFSGTNVSRFPQGAPRHVECPERVIS